MKKGFHGTGNQCSGKECLEGTGQGKWRWTIWTVSKHDRASRLNSAVAAETQCC